jgi:hypothetical protein
LVGIAIRPLASTEREEAPSNTPEFLKQLQKQVASGNIHHLNPLFDTVSGNKTRNNRPGRDFFNEINHLRRVLQPSERKMAAKITTWVRLSKFCLRQKN